MWAVQLDFKNAFCTLHRQTCLEVVSKLLGSRPAWFEAASNLLTRPAHLLSPGGEDPFSTYDGVPQGDPLSTLLFATTMTTVVRQAVATVDVPVNSVSYIDDTVLLGSPEDVASVLQELPTLARTHRLATTTLQDENTEPHARRCGFTPSAQRVTNHDVRHTWSHHSWGSCGS